MRGLTTRHGRAPLLERALAKAGAPLTPKVFPNANHGLFECRTGGLTELPVMHRYAPGYLTTLFDWLDAAVRTSGRRPPRN